jgi:muramoyltetrapeptide carboxypeptidase
MITPPFLKKGDKVGIIAPARKVTREEIQYAIETIKKWGLEVQLGRNLFCSYNQFAGTDDERADDLQQMLDDDTISAILCARGGYGTLRIIDRIDFRKFCEKPKWIVGYSDITVLHSHINHNLGIETLHATMPISFSQNEESVTVLRKALFGQRISYSLSSHPCNKKGKAEAILIGGNLSLLYALKGSKSFPSTEGKILFIEDVDEYLYHIDRMMLSLKRANKLSKLAGLIVGGMSNMKDNEIPFGKTAEEIILGTVKEFGYPVCFGFPAGHQTKNLALILGRRAMLTVANVSSLNYL